MDARARNLITMSNLSVHSLGGITSSSFRVLLSWYGDDGRSDLDLYLKCPECNCLVSHKDRICKCCEEIHLTVEKVGDEKSSNLGVEMVDVSSPTGRNNFSKCIQSITKGGILDEAATQKGIQLQIGDLIDLEADGIIRLLRPKLSRVELDVDHLGPSQMRSVQNVIVQQASNETYSLQVHLFAGDPVAYEVLVQRVGFPDVLYQLPPHAETDEMEDIFSMSGLQLQSKWEPLELDWESCHLARDFGWEKCRHEAHDLTWNIWHTPSQLPTVWYPKCGTSFMKSYSMHWKSSLFWLLLLLIGSRWWRVWGLFQ